MQLTELNHLLRRFFKGLQLHLKKNQPKNQNQTKTNQKSKPKPTDDNDRNTDKTISEVILLRGRFKLKFKQSKMTCIKCSK